MKKYSIKLSSGENHEGTESDPARRQEDSGEEAVIFETTTN